ncbi:uncharacterized protein LOC133190385 [Saccostrea echinata]|uniref:uncharacterized protein LOC133190385 n=1 Tax=Saccostrea echinata TaxID=191078 RepID=UPI002A7F5E72|nr:uncharacterized protein LOC133190385 [Saccostrea echinata]
MASEVYLIPTLQDIEKAVLELSSQVRLQSAFLDCQIEKLEEDPNMDCVVNENEAENILARTSSLRAELEKFKLNLKKYQEVTKEKRNSNESNVDKNEDGEDFPDKNTDDLEFNVDSDTIVAQPDSVSCISEKKPNGTAQENEDNSAVVTINESSS